MYSLLRPFLVRFVCHWWVCAALEFLNQPMSYYCFPIRDICGHWQSNINVKMFRLCCLFNRDGLYMYKLNFPICTLSKIACAFRAGSGLVSLQYEGFPSVCLWHRADDNKFSIIFFLDMSLFCYHFWQNSFDGFGITSQHFGLLTCFFFYLSFYSHSILMTSDSNYFC